MSCPTTQHNDPARARTKTSRSGVRKTTTFPTKKDQILAETYSNVDINFHCVHFLSWPKLFREWRIINSFTFRREIYQRIHNCEVDVKWGKDRRSLRQIKCFNGTWTRYRLVACCRVSDVTRNHTQYLVNPMLQTTSQPALDLYLEKSLKTLLLTWLKLSKAWCKLAIMPVGGSLVILMEDSRIPWGMIWDSGVPAGSAEMYTR